MGKTLRCGKSFIKPPSIDDGKKQNAGARLRTIRRAPADAVRLRRYYPLLFFLAPRGHHVAREVRDRPRHRGAADLHATRHELVNERLTVHQVDLARIREVGTGPILVGALL